MADLITLLDIPVDPWVKPVSLKSWLRKIQPWKNLNAQTLAEMVIRTAITRGDLGLTSLQLTNTGFAQHVCDAFGLNAAAITERGYRWEMSVRIPIQRKSSNNPSVALGPFAIPDQLITTACNTFMTDGSVKKGLTTAIQELRLSNRNVKGAEAFSSLGTLGALVATDGLGFSPNMVVLSAGFVLAVSFGAMLITRVGYRRTSMKNYRSLHEHARQHVGQTYIAEALKEKLSATEIIMHHGPPREYDVDLSLPSQLNVENFQDPSEILEWKRVLTSSAQTLRMYQLQAQIQSRENFDLVADATPLALDEISLCLKAQVDPGAPEGHPPVFRSIFLDHEARKPYPRRYTR